LTQSPRGACSAHGPGRKAALQAEQKAIFGLQTTQRLKSEETALQPNKETCGKSRWIQKVRLAKRIAINGRRDADQRLS
jgi:hypothetical protein